MTPLDPDTIARKEQAFRMLGMTPEEGWRMQALMREYSAADGVVACAEQYRDALARWPTVIDTHKVAPLEDQLVAAVDYLRKVRKDNEQPPYNADRRKP